MHIHISEKSPQAFKVVGKGKKAINNFCLFMADYVCCRARER
jgi:hypothetical protein